MSVSVRAGDRGKLGLWLCVGQGRQTAGEQRGLSWQRLVGAGEAAQGLRAPHVCEVFWTRTHREPQPDSCLILTLTNPFQGGAEATLGGAAWQDFPLARKGLETPRLP